MYSIRNILVGNPGDPGFGKKPTLVQGITGKYGNLHSRLMIEYGTNVVGGVVPGKGGQKANGVPVFDTMKDATMNTGSEISIIFVPPPFFLKACIEALEAGIKVVVGITEHVPVRDTLKILEEARKHEAVVIGPNTPGVIIPGMLKLGIMAAEPFSRGSIALFSRSGTLMYEVAHYLSTNGLGQSMTLGVGGDPINCTTLIECLEWVRDEEETKAIVIVGEIGGDAEERLAEHILSTNYPKPVVAYVAGRYVPKEKKMGHAGAIIYGSYGTAESKVKAFNEAGVLVASRPSQIPTLVKEVLSKRAK